MPNKEVYTHGFYDDQAMASHRSAERVLQHMLSLFPSIQSVIDVGCGTGSWLSAAKNIGIDKIYGMEGSLAAKDMLMIPDDNWHAVDVTKPFNCGQRFDLAMSLEVAEHLPFEKHGVFIENIIQHSDLVLFSAAIPYQGGTGHQTENWPSYWAQLFSSKGFRCYDLLRHRIWNQRGINFWYKQNLLVFIREGAEEKFNMKIESSIESPISIIHPELYLWAINRAGGITNAEYNRDIAYYLRVKDLDPNVLSEEVTYGDKYNNEF